MSASKVLRIVCVLFVVAAALAVGTTSVTAQDRPAECKSGTKLINFWHGLSGPDGRVLESMVGEYNKNNNDGLCVKWTLYHWDVFFDKWLSGVAAGNPPDVVVYHINEMPQYAGLGAVVAIDEMAKQAGIDMKIFPAEQQKLSLWDGKLMGVPLDIHPIGMYYNVDMVKAAGLDPAKPPTDQKTFLEWGQKLTKSDGSQYGVCLASVNVQLFRVWYGWLWQNDAKFISDDNKTITVSSKEAEETLQFAVDLVNKYKVAAESVQDPDVDFQSKKCAIHFQGPWWVKGYMDTKGLNFMTAPQPVLFKKPGVWASDHFFGISKQDNKDNQLAGMKFVKWMIDNAALWGLAGQVPAAESARNDKRYTESEQYKYLKAFVDEVPYARLTPVIPQSTEIFAENVQTPLVQNWQAAMLKAKDVSTALKDMQAGIQKVLDKK